MEKRGWWQAKITLTTDDGYEISWDDLDDFSREHVCRMIERGYREGELCIALPDNE